MRQKNFRELHTTGKASGKGGGKGRATKKSALLSGLPDDAESISHNNGEERGIPKRGMEKDENPNTGGFRFRGKILGSRKNFPVVKNLVS